MGHTKYNKDIVSIIDKLRWFANIQRNAEEYKELYHTGYDGFLLLKNTQDAYYNFRELSSFHYTHFPIYNKGRNTFSKIPKNY